ncbi:MAG: ATP-binding protein, partial [Acaryochloridaceae cyanobacterium RL_2_7]|nr:ATP-binding protein [Acaryochloridaceae cyanobacterium RL_2_7]
IFMDEIDALGGITLLSILRQLRDGYGNRPQNFPHSVALVGLRDVRDYKIASGGSDRLNTASPFNIKVESLTLRNFNRTEIAQLYVQHTDATGQSFNPDAVDQVYDLTQGQPWLVNALARQAVQTLETDRRRPITLKHIEEAKELLIQRRDTHIDSLAERLREPRVKAIIEPILVGSELGAVPNDDVEFLLDLGLCRIDETGNLAIANPIYREVLPRTLAFTTTISLGQITPSWLNSDGGLEVDALLEAFLKFWKQNGQPLLKGISYHEIAPHIVLMAFLHRVVNGSGTLEREYAIGSDRMDLCLRYGSTTVGIELKVWRDQRPDPLKKGLGQLDRYLTGLSLDTGWLVIFDQRSGQPPMSERTKVEPAQTPTGKNVTVIRA